LGNQENEHVVDAATGWISAELVMATGKGASSPARCGRLGALLHQPPGHGTLLLLARSRALQMNIIHLNWVVTFTMV
jgi:hypothetical protein